MDVLISAQGAPYVDGNTVYVDFLAVGKTAEQVFSVRFRLAYVWGLTAAQRTTGIINAAAAAKELYEAAHGALPAVNRTEILL